VVLLHGMMSTGATWWRIGPALAGRGWAVDAIDLPGHGDWPPTGRPLDLDRLVGREREANPAWADEDVEHSVDGIAAADAAAVAGGLRAELTWDLPALVAAVRVPLLVLAARGGFAEGGSALQEPARAAVRALLPPDRFVVLDGGHCLHRDLPDRWLAEVGGFADEVLGGG
jgi:pimeloyl-ACP methyl ester carboxylesterase